MEREFGEKHIAMEVLRPANIAERVTGLFSIIHQVRREIQEKPFG